MTNEQFSEPIDSSSPIPVGLRIGIALITVLIIGFFGWQYWSNQSSDADNPAAVTNGDSTITEGSPSEQLFERGNQSFQRGNFDQAVDAYQKAIDLNSNYDAAYANLGAVYYAQGELDLAAEAYLKAIDLSPNDADVIYNLGAIYLQQAVSTGQLNNTKLELALEQINKAIELNPNLAQPYYGLGVAQQLIGKNEDAIESFETFLELDDGADRIATDNARQILEQLKASQP